MLDLHCFTLSNEHKTDLLNCYWFQSLTKIIQSKAEDDAGQAVKRAVFWFYDAQNDSAIEMRLVKYWSCIECFFSFENDGRTTDKIIRGMLTILTCGRHQFSSPEKWKTLERDINRLYSLRSRAVHDAKHNHVSWSDVNMISKWAAWVLLEVAQLITNGFKTRLSIKNEIDRVYELCLSRDSK